MFRTNLLEILKMSLLKGYVGDPYGLVRMYILEPGLLGIKEWFYP